MEINPKPRTAKATETFRRNARFRRQERMAAELLADGWSVHPPKPFIEWAKLQSDCSCADCSCPAERRSGVA